MYPEKRAFGRPKAKKAVSLKKPQNGCLMLLNFSLFRDILKKIGIAFVAVSYKKLFHILIDRDITNTQLQRMAGYSANITAHPRNSTYGFWESI